MSTLEEIEKIVPTLTREELDHLEAMLVKWRSQAPQTEQDQPKERRSPADFSGVLRLSEDPLDWQKKIRQEWE